MNIVKRLIFINLCVLFLIDSAFAAIYVAAEDTITISGSCVDYDCAGTDSVTITWSDSTGRGTGTDVFPNGNTGTSVNWKAPATAGEVDITASCDDTPGNDDDDSVSDIITIRVVRVDIDIWNGKTNGAGYPVPDPNETTVGAYLLVNCDDDNSDDDPDLDDSSVTGENDLSKISLDCSEGSTGTLEIIKTGSNIKIWQSVTKETEQTTLSWDLTSVVPPSFLWIEGTGASSSERDVQLELEYTVGETSVSDIVKATVVEIRLGNAVYRENKFWVQQDRGHSAMVYEYTGACNASDLNDSTKFTVIEMQQDGPINTNTMATMTDDESYGAFGCYTNADDITYAKRLAIIKTAEAIVANAALIDYTSSQALKCDDDDDEENWDGTLSDISALRCDGLIEVCYEMNGIDVWAMERDYGGATSYNYDISSQTDILNYDAFWGTWSAGSNNEKDNLEEHNDFDPSALGWYDTLMPATQCGYVTPVDATTEFSAQDLCSPIGHTGGN